MTNIDDLVQDEEHAFEAFKHKYLLQHPIKDKPRIVGLNWMFWIVLFVSGAQILLAALRTASIFYKAAELGGSVPLAWAEAVLAVISVEMGLVIYSAIRAAKKKELSRDTSMMAILLMVAISVFAGLSQSINLITGIDPQFLRTIQYCVSFTIGIGASIIAWVGGDALGTQISAVNINSAQNDDEYDQYLDDVNARMLSAWSRSKEKQIGQVVVQDRSMPVQQLNKVEQISKSQDVYEWISANARTMGWQQVQDIPSAREIVEQFKGYNQDINPSSAQNGRDRWIRDNLKRS